MRRARHAAQSATAPRHRPRGTCTPAAHRGRRTGRPRMSREIRGRIAELPERGELACRHRSGSRPHVLTTTRRRESPVVVAREMPYSSLTARSAGCVPGAKSSRRTRAPRRWRPRPPKARPLRSSRPAAAGSRRRRRGARTPAADPPTQLAGHRPSAGVAAQPQSAPGGNARPDVRLRSSQLIHHRSPHVPIMSSYTGRSRWQSTDGQRIGPTNAGHGAYDCDRS